MSEKHIAHKQSYESPTPSAELHAHHERLARHHEKSAEAAQHETHEQAEARHEVHEQAISGNEYHRPHAEKRQHTPVHTTAEAKKHSFNATMHHVRNNLNTPEKTFSKIIHKPAVEKASEIAGSTIARPSGVAGATILAFIGLLSVYGIARFAGFELSGSEMPLLLAIGFIAGLIIEWLYKSLRSLRGTARLDGNE